MYYFVYKTYNLRNGKFYIGSHSSNINPLERNDGYLGSGALLVQDIQKYGRSNFYREIIEICASAQEMRDIERILIKSMLGKKNCYNIAANCSIGTIGHHFEYQKRDIEKLKNSKLTENQILWRLKMAEKVLDNLKNKYIGENSTENLYIQNQERIISFLSNELNKLENNKETCTLKEYLIWKDSFNKRTLAFQQKASRIRVGILSELPTYKEYYPSKGFLSSTNFVNTDPATGDIIQKSLKVIHVWVTNRGYIAGYKLQCVRCSHQREFVGIRSVREKQVRYCSCLH